MKSILLFLVPLPLLISCYSYTTFQTPEVLEKGETILGVGISNKQPWEDQIFPEIYFRKPFVRTMDWGFKFKGIPITGGVILFDMKKSLMTTSIVTLSADLGLSFSSFNAEDLAHFQTIGIYPTLMLGNDHLYMGLKYNKLLISGNIDLFGDIPDQTSSMGIPSYFFGATLGTGLRLQPEITIFQFPDHEMVVSYALGFTRYIHRSH